LKKWFTELVTITKSFNINIRNFMIANFCTQIGMGVFMVMYNIYIKELGLSESVNGSVVSLNALALVIMLVPAGLISDRLGRKNLIVAGTILTICMLTMRSLATSEQSILALAFCTGLVWAFVQVSGVPFLAENSTAQERMHLFSIHFSLVTIANVLGNLFGGVLADAFQLFGMPVVESIRFTLLVGCCIFLAGIPFMLKVKIPTRKARLTAKASSDIGQSSKPNFKRNFKMIALFSVSNCLIGIGAGLVIPYLNLYFSNRFDAANSTIGFILALGSAMTAVAMLLGPKLVARVGKVNALLIFQFASIPFLFLSAFTNSLMLAVIGFLMRQALMNAGNPITSAIAMEVVDDRYKGFANSVNQMIFNVGWALMGLPAAWLVTTYGNYWGYAYTFTITGCIYLVASMYFYLVFGKRYKLKDTIK
jgi:MFS family permease